MAALLNFYEQNNFEIINRSVSPECAEEAVQLSAGSLQCAVCEWLFLFQNVLRELERRKADLKSITESCTTLQALVEGSETSLEEKLCVLNAGWSRVRTWTEDWCDTLLVSCT